MVEPSEQRFAVCSFGRVFDVEPKKELLSLGEILRFVSRFEVKPQVLQRMRKGVAKVEKSLERVLDDSPGAGHIGAKLREAMRSAEQDGGDPVAAAKQLADSLAHDVRQSVKRDLRLWSPALYKPGARRGSEGVVHQSLVTGSRKYTYIAEELPAGIADLPEAQGVAPRWEPRTRGTRSGRAPRVRILRLRPRRRNRRPLFDHSPQRLHERRVSLSRFSVPRIGWHPRKR